MSQLLAMQVRPAELDIAGAAHKAAQVQGARANSQLSQLKLRDEQGRSDAVHGYREGLKAGDPNASEALAGYPELEAQFQETFDSMESAKEKKEAAKRAKALGAAARELAMFPEGPERQAAAEDVLARLVSEGVIDEDMAEQAKKTGVTDLFLSQYLTLDEWVQREFPDVAADAKTGGATGGAKAGKTEGGRMKSVDVKRVEDMVNNFRKRRATEIGLEGAPYPLEAEERAALQQQLDADAEEFRARIEAQITGRPAPQRSGRGDLQPNAQTGALPSTASQPAAQQPAQQTGAPTWQDASAGRARPSKGGAKAQQYTQDNPAKPVSQADFDALPAGAIFINPADGLLYRKD